MPYNNVVRALYAYEAAAEDELSFAEDELLCIIEEEEGAAWLLARPLQSSPNGDDQEGLTSCGLVPANYIEPLEAQCTLVALYDYVAQEDNELCLNQEELLALLSKLDANWWLVRNGEGRVGLVPANYVDVQVQVDEEGEGDGDGKGRGEKHDEILCTSAGGDLFASHISNLHLADDMNKEGKRKKKKEESNKDKQHHGKENNNNGKNAFDQLFSKDQVQKKWSVIWTRQGKGQKGYLAVIEGRNLLIFIHGKPKLVEFQYALSDLISYDRKAALLTVRDVQEPYRIEMGKGDAKELQGIIKKHSTPLSLPNEKIPYDRSSLIASTMTNDKEEMDMRNYNDSVKQMQAEKESEKNSIQEQTVNFTRLVRVLYTYEPREDDELRVEEGERVLLLDDASDDWWLVKRLDAGERTGLVPRTYVTERLEEEEEQEIKEDQDDHHYQNAEHAPIEDSDQEGIEDGNLKDDHNQNVEPASIKENDSSSIPQSPQSNNELDDQVQDESNQISKEESDTVTVMEGKPLPFLNELLTKSHQSMELLRKIDQQVSQPNPSSSSNLVRQGKVEADPSTDIPTKQSKLHPSRDPSSISSLAQSLARNNSVQSRPSPLPPPSLPPRPALNAPSLSPPSSSRPPSPPPSSSSPSIPPPPPPLPPSLNFSPSTLSKPSTLASKMVSDPKSTTITKPPLPTRSTKETLPPKTCPQRSPPSPRETIPKVETIQSITNRGVQEESTPPTCPPPKPNPWSSVTLRRQSKGTGSKISIMGTCSDPPQNAPSTKTKALPSRPEKPASDQKPSPVDTRLWKDRTGKFQVEAAFISFEQGAVLIHKLNGSKVTVPIDLLSERDVEYVYRRCGLPWEKSLADCYSFRGFDWLRFLTMAGVEIRRAAEYARRFVEASCEERWLETSATREHLKTTAQMAEGDILLVLNALTKRRMERLERASAAKNLEWIAGSTPSQNTGIAIRPPPAANLPRPLEPQKNDPILMAVRPSVSQDSSGSMMTDPLRVAPVVAGSFNQAKPITMTPPSSGPMVPQSAPVKTIKNIPVLTPQNTLASIRMPPNPQPLYRHFSTTNNITTPSLLPFTPHQQHQQTTTHIVMRGSMPGEMVSNGLAGILPPSLPFDPNHPGMIGTGGWGGIGGRMGSGIGSGIGGGMLMQPNHQSLNPTMPVMPNMIQTFDPPSLFHPPPPSVSSNPPHTLNPPNPLNPLNPLNPPNPLNSNQFPYPQSSSHPIRPPNFTPQQESDKYSIFRQVDPRSPSLFAQQPSLQSRPSQQSPNTFGS